MAKRVAKAANDIDVAEHRDECKTHADARIIGQLHFDRMLANKVGILSDLDAALHDYQSACLLTESIYRCANEKSSDKVCNLLFNGRRPVLSRRNEWTIPEPDHPTTAVVPAAVPSPIVSLQVVPDVPSLVLHAS